MSCHMFQVTVTSQRQRPVQHRHGGTCREGESQTSAAPASTTIELLSDEKEKRRYAKTRHPQVRGGRLPRTSLTGPQGKLHELRHQDHGSLRPLVIIPHPDGRREVHRTHDHADEVAGRAVRVPLVRATDSERRDHVGGFHPSCSPPSDLTDPKQHVRRCRRWARQDSPEHAPAQSPSRHSERPFVYIRGRPPRPGLGEASTSCRGLPHAQREGTVSPSSDEASTGSGGEPNGDQVEGEQ
jgi:hypothetical protein